MQLKHLLVALVVLLALVGTAAAADSAEVRSELLDYYGLTSSYVSQLDATSWAGFYYDINSGVSTEEISMLVNANGLSIKYETTPEFQKYDFDFGTGLGYAVIGFFAEPYVALGKNDTTSALTGIKANKIAKLIIDNDERYLLKTGSTLELGEGYSLIVDQIDVDGNKAYIKFMKDGRELNSSIVTTGTGGDGQWSYTLSILGETNIEVMRLHVKSVFQGTQDSLVEIEGLWLIDYLNAIEVKSDTDFGKWEADSIGTGSLSYVAANLSINDDENLNLGKDIFLRTGKNFTNSTPHDMYGMFYLYKVYTDEGTYDIRSSVGQLTSLPQPYDYKNFAAFYFDINTGIETETLLIEDGSVAGKYDITYVTIPDDVSYAFTGATTWASTYYVMGLFGEKYVPLNIFNKSIDEVDDYKQDKIAKLVIDSDERYLLKTGSTLELGEGYTIAVDQIDVDGNKAYIKFMKDGRELNSSIVTTGAGSTTDNSWVFDATVLNEKNVQVMRLHVKSVFQGTQDSLVEVEGLWLMDYLNVRELKSGDKFGLLEYDGAGVFSETDISLGADDDRVVANNMSVRVAEDGDRFYFYVEATVGAGNPGPQQPDIPDVPAPGPVDPVDPPAPGPVDPVDPPVGNDNTDEKGWFAKNWMYILAAIVLIIIIAGVAYYFLVMKKQ
jgi:S-layer-related duplication domain